MLFRQRVISPKNIQMAMDWTASEDPEVSELAQIVADIAGYTPLANGGYRFSGIALPVCGRE